MNKKQLILDAGGVIVTNLTPGFWETIAAAASKTYEEIRAAYAADIRDALWTGTLAEAEFWRWLSAHCPGLAEREARTLLQRSIRLLPAFHCIPAWSRLADVHILSNHRAEWLAPHLEGLRPHLGHVVVSSEAGASKPSGEIYEALRAKLNPSASVLYVDDQRKNLTAAEVLGWQGLLADEEGSWIEQANRWLHEE